MKITFAEFQQWHDTAWPEGYIWTDETLLPDGRDLYDPEGGWNPDIRADEKIDIADLPEVELQERENAGRPQDLNVGAAIRKWRKMTTTTAMVVIVPNGDVDAFKAVCAERGWRLG